MPSKEQEHLDVLREMHRKAAAERARKVYLPRVQELRPNLSLDEQKDLVRKVLKRGVDAEGMEERSPWPWDKKSFAAC